MAANVSVSLSIEEVNVLVALLDEKERLHSGLLNDNFEIPLKRKLLDALTKQQTEDFIRLEVKKVLSRASGKPVQSISDNDSLTDDLHLTSPQIRALGVPFTNIANKFKSGVVITPDECEECETVDDCVTLIMDKIK